MGGYGVLSTVSEGGTYQSLTSPTDEEATYAVSKKGGLEDITMEMIADDDVGAIRRIPTKLARAAQITLYRAVFGTFVTNAAVTYDSVALFNATHANLGTTALSAAELTVVKIAMRDQAAYGDSINFLGIKPKWLIIPAELEALAIRLRDSEVMVQASAFTATEPNVHYKSFDYIIVDYWTDATDWFVVADPTTIPTLEVGFYQGRQEPELFTQDQPEVGSVFTADKITYKIRHIYGVGVLDHRGMYGEWGVT